jgi:hypothetical protein
MRKEINIIEKTRNAYMSSVNFWHSNRVAPNDIELDTDLSNRDLVQIMMDMPEVEVSSYKDQYGYDFWIAKDNEDNTEVIYHDRYREVEVR